MPDIQQVQEAIRQSGRDGRNLGKSAFTLSQGTSGEETKVAEYQVGQDVVLRNDKPLKLAVTAYETYTTDGTGGNTETINLAGNIIESPNTADLFLYDETNDTVVQEDSIDYANNSVDYTDSGTGNTIGVYYIARDPGMVKIYKKAPSSQGGVEERVFDEATSLLHEQDQHTDPVTVGADQSALQAVVPENWKIVVKVDVPYTVKLSTAGNPLLQVPVAFLQDSPEGLSKAVAQDVIERL